MRSDYSILLTVHNFVREDGFRIRQGSPPQPAASRYRKAEEAMRAAENLLPRCQMVTLRGNDGLVARLSSRGWRGSLLTPKA